MDCMESIMSRRSIRNYTDAPVTEQELETVLRAAMAAPSAGNQQSWRFVVARDAATRERLAQCTPYAGPLARAQVALVVCGDTRDERHPGYWVQDCSAAIENLLLAAHAIGLGAVWIGVHPLPERAQAVREVCALPQGIEPLSMVALGHPAEDKPAADRYDPTLVHLERWRDR